MSWPLTFNLLQVAQLWLTDCLHLKSPLCSCQHCQWFCAGCDAVAIRRARITQPNRHPPNAYEILVTRYDQFPMRATFGKYLTGKGTSPTNLCCCHKTRMIAISCGIKISAAHHLVLSQYTRRTDTQICDSNTVRCITCSHTGKTKVWQQWQEATDRHQ